MFGHAALIKFKKIGYIKLFLFNDPYDIYIRNLRYKLFQHYKYKNYLFDVKLKI